MKKCYLLAMVILALTAGNAFAGAFVESGVNGVFVDLTNRSARGDMVNARFSDNDVEHIGCGMRVFDFGPGGIFSFGFCRAASKEGVEITCTTQNTDLIDAMKATSDFAFLIFSWNADDECTRVGFSTQSIYIPNFKRRHN